MSKRKNFVVAADAYKMTHWLQTPPGTQIISSYLESRGGMFDETMMYGLQGLIKEHFAGQVVQPWMINEAEELCKEVFGTDKYFNRKGWTHILNKHDGRLPIRIRAVPEGLAVPTHNVLCVVENTDPLVPWLTNFCETLLMQVWYPITVATLAWKIRRLIAKFAEKTGCPVSPFHLNDFGFRGVSSFESSGIGGSAVLASGWLGTDTLSAIMYLKKFYHAKACGHSVFATEHSTTTIWGLDNEQECWEHALAVAPDDAILSFVVDSKDTVEAVSNIIGVKLKEKILARKGKVVCRPDSGDPVKVSVEVLQILWNRFGGTTNPETGYKILDPHVGVIYGDGINYRSIGDILEAVVAAGFCVSNIVFGMGGKLLQGVDRDTQKFAFKCSWAQVNGKGREVFKQPKTDSGKNSKKGLIKLARTEFNQLCTIPLTDTKYDDILVPVFENGEILRSWTLDEVRKLADCQ
jgi:nicotinamide phosphoribosyltransferase